MNTDRIKEIQKATAYPESVSVQQALLQVWNECEQERNVKIAEANNTDLTAEFHEILSDLCGSDAAYNFQTSDLYLIYQAMSKAYEMGKTDK